MKKHQYCWLEVLFLSSHKSIVQSFMLSLLLITSLVLKYLQFNWNSYDETNSSFWLCMSKQYYHASQIGMYSNDKQELGLCLVLQHIFIMTDKVYAFVWQNHCKDCDVRHYSFILSLSTLNVSGSMIVLWFMCMCTINETKYKHDNSQSLLKDFLTTHKQRNIYQWIASLILWIWWCSYL